MIQKLTFKIFLVRSVARQNGIGRNETKHRSPSREVLFGGPKPTDERARAVFRHEFLSDGSDSQLLEKLAQHERLQRFSSQSKQ